MSKAKDPLDAAKVYLVRSVLSSIPPITSYVIAYFGFLKAVGSSSGIAFLDYRPWCCIAAISFLWPLQQLSMSLMFEPIIFIIKWKMRMDQPLSKTKKDKDGRPLPLVPFFLKGNFKPMLVESAYKVVDITEGKVPNDISGTFLKNGPN